MVRTRVVLCLALCSGALALPSHEAERLERSAPRPVGGIACGMCKATMWSAKKLGVWFNKHVTEPVSAAMAVGPCEDFEADGHCDMAKATYSFDPCEDFCMGMATRESKVFERLITDPEGTPTNICAAGGSCPIAPVAEPDWSNPQTKTDVNNFKGEPKVARWANKKQRSRKFCHFSDVHLQQNYIVGNENDCGQPVCCREEVGVARSNHTAAGKFGSARCDMPTSSFKSMMAAMAKHDCDFVLQTGDAPAHDAWSQTEGTNVEAQNVITAELKKHFGKVPVVQILGNWGPAVKSDYMGPGVDKSLYQQMTNQWQPWMSDEAKLSASYGARYAIRVLPKLWAIALHSSMLMDTGNVYVQTKRRDIGNQLPWLKFVLTGIRERGEKVLLLMHHPLGSAIFGPMLEDIIAEFSDVVQASFAGHSHSTWFTASEKTNVMEYVTGGGGGLDDLNPTFRVFDYAVDNDDNFKAITDFKSYYADFEQANIEGEMKWEVASRARADYKLKDLSVASWRKLAQSWLPNGDDETWTRFAIAFSRNKQPIAQVNRVVVACAALCSIDDNCFDRCKGDDSRASQLVEEVVV